MITSERDPRSYRVIERPDGMRLLFVSEPDARECAIAVTLRYGHFNDPKAIPGLAHLLEHLLFNGSQSYPEDNGIIQFADNHTGTVNAWTATEVSAYYLSVPPHAFEESVARLQDMLQQPLFNTEAIAKEITAIDAEFKLKVNDDSRRLQEVHKETCNPAHPFSQFSVGNNSVFNRLSLEQLQMQLRAFHRRYFVPENMCVCIQTPAPLEEMVAQYQHVLTTDIDTPSETGTKSATPPLLDRTANSPYPDVPLYLEEQLGCLIKVQPQKETQQLILSFAMPNLHPYYRSKPEAVISQMLGDEGEGSLFHDFKTQGWAVSLAAGGGVDGYNFKDFNISIQLTTEGLMAVDSIVERIFSYINMMREDELANWRFAEKQQLNHLAFEYQEPQRPQNYCQHLAVQMHYYPNEDIVFGEYRLDQQDRAVILDALSYCTPSNMRIKLVTKMFDTDTQSKWYQTPYSIEKLPQDWLEALAHAAPQPQLHLPVVNQYLPKRLKSIDKNTDFGQPQVISKAHNGELWFAQDLQFGLPKGDFFLSLESASVPSIKQSTLRKLWASMQQEYFDTDFYNATLAGMHLHFYSHQNGCSIRTNGFADQQLALAQKLLQTLQSKEYDPKQFAIAQQALRSKLHNTVLNKPINRLFNVLSVLLQKQAYLPEDMVDIVSQCRLQDINDLRDELLHTSHWQGLLFGDWQPSQAQEFGAWLANLPSEGLYNEDARKVLDVSGMKSRHIKVSSQHADSAMVIYLQAPDGEIASHAKTILTEQLLASGYFQTMRTEKQLGYFVGTGYFPQNQHPGIVLYIQSPSVKVDPLIAETNQFLNQCIEEIRQINADDWDRLRQSIARQLIAPDINLSMKAQRLWMAIGNGDTQFNQQQNIANQIAQLSIDDVDQYVQTLLQFERRVILYSQEGGNIAAEHLPDLAYYKDSPFYRF